MVKWKLQAVEPDTCSDGQCRYLEWWDVEADVLLRTHTVAAFERVCAAHFTPELEAHIAADEMLGFDGNWKPRKAYIEYQRSWFRRLNHVEWLARNPGEAMPPQIANLSRDPATTGSIATPPTARSEALGRAYEQNRAHNALKNAAIALIKQERSDTEPTWEFTGQDDARTLRLHHDGKLNPQQSGRVRAALDIQFGTNKATLSD